MSIAVKSTFWVLTFGSIGWALFTFVKPDDELLKKLDKESAHTDTRKFANRTIDVLKGASDPNSDITRKVDELLKKGK